MPVRLRELVPVLVFFAGIAVVTVGIWWIYPPAALIFAGALLALFAVNAVRTAEAPR